MAAAVVVLLGAAVLATSGTAPVAGLLTAGARPVTGSTLVPPTITQEPTDATDTGRAKFKLEHPRKDVTFECSLDGSPFATCHQNVQYKDLPPADHCFRAVAVAGGSQSEPAESCWTNLDKATFGISGSTTQPFFPGRAQAVDLRLANPHNQDIHVQSVEITVDPATTTDGAPNPDCVGDENLEVTRQFDGPVTVPAKATLYLSDLGMDEARWPVLTMPNLPVNQDACKSTDFTITYSGTASK